MATPVTVQVAILVSTVSTGKRLWPKGMERPYRNRQGHRNIMYDVTSSRSQDGSAVPSGLVGKPNLWALQL